LIQLLCRPQIEWWRFAHMVKCVRMLSPVSRAPQPHCARVGLAVRGSASPAAQHAQPRWTSTLNLQVPRRRSTSPEAAGHFAHAVKCARIWRRELGAATPTAFHPLIRGPDGGPRLTFESLPRRSPCSEAAGRFAHMVKLRAHLAPGAFGAGAQPDSMRRPGGLATLGFPVPPSAVQVVRGSQA
jgi:hypothetical protein